MNWQDLQNITIWTLVCTNHPMNHLKYGFSDWYLIQLYPQRCAGEWVAASNHKSITFQIKTNQSFWFFCGCTQINNVCIVCCLAMIMFIFNMTVSFYNVCLFGFTAYLQPSSIHWFQKSTNVPCMTSQWRHKPRNLCEICQNVQNIGKITFFGQKS